MNIFNTSDNSENIPQVKPLGLLFSDIRETMAIVWQAAPLWNIISFLLVFLQGLLPLISLLLMKLIIDCVSSEFANGDISHAKSRLILLVSLEAGVALLLLFCRAAATFTNEVQSQLVLEKFAGLIHAQTCAIDLEAYENVQQHNLLSRAQQDALIRPQAVYDSVLQLLQNGISVIAVYTLLLSYNWLLTVIVSLIAIPGAFVGLVYGRKMHALLTEQVEAERRSKYYNMLLTDPLPAKELRLFQLGPYFAQLFQQVRANLRQQRLKLFRRRAEYDFLAQGLATISIFAALGYIGFSALEGAITIGAMVMYFQGFQTAFSNEQIFLRSLTNLYENSLFLENIFIFLKMKPSVVLQAPEMEYPLQQQRGLRVENLSFSYPNTSQPALLDINIELAPGKVIALVGANGSGKTTLVKLLTRLYDPSAGRILFEDTDIRNINPVIWRQHISVLFQDYMRYQHTVYDNISFGDITRQPDIKDVQSAARDAGIDEKVSIMPQGYNTMLGKGYTGGTELSCGEWQKIAIARAYLRNANIIVLDEPSSALDPIAEAELFTRFRTLTAGKSAVLISHRFTTVQMADYIYVFEKGRIVEQGNHPTLMRKDGVYANLYRTQAALYDEQVYFDQADSFT